VNISRCIAVALLVASTSTGCSSCVKDDARPSESAPSGGPTTALTERRIAPLPRGFERRPPGNLTPVTVPVMPPGSAAPVAPVVDAGTDATTH
jgi:hypothetical protein